VVFKPTFHRLLSLVKEKLFAGAKIAVLMQSRHGITLRSVELGYVGKEPGCLNANHWWTESATLARAFIDAIEKPTE
jgi:hypothetical protein